MLVHGFGASGDGGGLLSDISGVTANPPTARLQVAQVPSLLLILRVLLLVLEHLSLRLFRYQLT